MMLMTPRKALLPYETLLVPRTTSIRSMSSSATGMVAQLTPLPNSGEYIERPSMSTWTRGE